MANTVIQIKRSSSAAKPASLQSGELGYSYSSNILYIGTGTDAFPIGGQNYINILNVAYTTANTANLTANLAYAASAAAFAKANAALANSGGTISGDLVVQGNITVSGLTTYANTQTLLIGDNILTLNADLPTGVAPSENAGMEINRGSSANVSLIWNEATDRWTFTNDGTNYFNLPTTTDLNSVGTGANNFATSSVSAANTFLLSVIAGANSAVGAGANAYTDSANTFLRSVISGANTAVGAGANAYTDAANTFLRSVIAGANTAVGTGANTYLLSVIAGANTAVGGGANAYTNAANTFLLSVIAGANTAVGTGANTYLLSVISGANTAVGTGANAYAALVGSAANTNAANASYLSTGTVPSARVSGSYTGITGVGTLTAGTWNASTIQVPYGGTGLVSITTNGVVYGNGANAVQVTAAGTEGQVLQASSTGIPTFGMLDGGVF